MSLKVVSNFFVHGLLVADDFYVIAECPCLCNSNGWLSWQCLCAFCLYNLLKCMYHVVSSISL